jgi:hypothetical protein
MASTPERRVCTLHDPGPCPRGSVYLHYYATEMTVSARDIKRGDRAPIGHLGDMTSVCALRKDDDGVHLADAVDVALDRFKKPVSPDTMVKVWRVTRDPKKR